MEQGRSPQRRGGVGSMRRRAPVLRNGAVTEAKPHSSRLLLSRVHPRPNVEATSGTCRSGCLLAPLDGLSLPAHGARQLVEGNCSAI
jgi:hypothetical protein